MILQSGPITFVLLTTALSEAWAKFVAVKTDCNYGEKIYSMTLVARRDRDVLTPRCSKFQHNQCMQGCQWISSCRNMGYWGQGENHFVAGLRFKVKGTMPKVKTYEVKCCQSKSIDVLSLSCEWEEISRVDLKRRRATEQAKGATKIIRDIRHIVKDGKIVFEAEVCRLRQKWCVIKPQPREGFGFAPANQRLRNILPANVQGFPASVSRNEGRRSTFLKPPRTPPNIRIAPDSREGPVRASATRNIQSERSFKTQISSSAPSCSTMGLMSYGDVVVEPIRHLVNPRGSAVRLSCRGTEVEHGILESELRDEPDLAEDLALFPLNDSNPLTATCSRGGVWELLGGVPLESDCT